MANINFSRMNVKNIPLIFEYENFKLNLSSIDDIETDGPLLDLDQFFAENTEANESEGFQITCHIRQLCVCNKVIFVTGDDVLSNLMPIKSVAELNSNDNGSDPQGRDLSFLIRSSISHSSINVPFKNRLPAVTIP